MPASSDNNAMSSLSFDQKIALATCLLKQTPPGEFADVLQDMQVILNNDEESMGHLYEAVRERNLQSGVTVTFAMPKGEEVEQPVSGVEEGSNTIKVPLTVFNELSDGRFFDPDTGAVLTVNHYNLEVENVCLEEVALRCCQDPQRLKIKDSLRGYLRQTLPQGLCKVFYNAERSEYVILMVGERFQLRNMRNGQWHSLWTLTVDSVNKVIAGKGMIKVIVHYFEDGNVQLQAQRECNFELETSKFAVEEGSTGELAREIVERIKEVENEIQLAINESYGQLSDTTFKKLRRQLPVTRAKVDWTKLASYKVGDQLPAQASATTTESPIA